MSKKLMRIAGSITVALLCGNAQAADIIYETPSPGLNSSALFSDAAGTSGFNAAATKAQPVASTVNGIEWWGFYSNPAAEGSGTQDAFTLNFYAGASSTPGTLLGSFALGTGNRVATGNKPFNYYNQYSYSAGFDDFALTGGPYFVSIVNSNPGASDWAWQVTGSLGGVGGAARSAATGQWAVNANANMAFRLTYAQPVNVISPVPEPETYAMMLAGLALLGGIARRRKAQQT